MRRTSLLALLLAVAALLFGADALAGGLGDFVSPGELAAAHADLSGITQCTACHELGAGVSPTKCMACHDRVRDQVQQKQGFHADKGTACASCHPDHRGADFNLTVVVQEKFDHAATGFALHGAHTDVACEECHTTKGDWTGLEQRCVGCHASPHGKETRPGIQDCARCHDDVDWDALPLPKAAFDHADPAQADFALHGQHEKVECEKCHAKAVFAPRKADACTDCHKDPHGGQFAPRACDACHTVDVAKFALPRFPHDKTAFPLQGAHREVPCAKCHGSGKKARYVPLPHDRCETCHKDPHHGQFAPRSCDACHSTTSFALAGFDHDTTKFPLRGEHAKVACEACHPNAGQNDFSAPEVEDCSTCHEDPHQQSFIPDACTSCHTDGVWAVDAFDHARTRFGLTGKHVEVACADCHGAGPERALAGNPLETCTTCHQDDSPHGEAFAGEECSACHDAEEWERAAATFDHEARAGWPLAFAHAEATCEACHGDDRAYQGQDGDACASCHEDDRPKDHFEGECATCHIVEAWAKATISPKDHARLGFPLAGAHADAACSACHDGSPTGPFCADCHAGDDPHRNLLGNDCASCHPATDWNLARFVHATTGFPLRGAHAVAACVDCHATAYVGTPTECRRCHLADKPGDSFHRDALTDDCGACHRELSWDLVRNPHGGN